MEIIYLVLKKGDCVLVSTSSAGTSSSFCIIIFYYIGNNSLYGYSCPSTLLGRVSCVKGPFFTGQDFVVCTSTVLRKIVVLRKKMCRFCIAEKVAKTIGFTVHCDRSNKTCRFLCRAEKAPSTIGYYVTVDKLPVCYLYLEYLVLVNAYYLNSLGIFEKILLLIIHCYREPYRP
jgi:hypothetical protein